MVAHPIAQGGQLLKRMNGDACGVPWGCEGLLAVGAQVVVEEEFITVVVGRRRRGAWG